MRHMVHHENQIGERGLDLFEKIDIRSHRTNIELTEIREGKINSVLLILSRLTLTKDFRALLT